MHGRSSNELNFLFEIDLFFSIALISLAKDSFGARMSFTSKKLLELCKKMIIHRPRDGSREESFKGTPA